MYPTWTNQASACRVICLVGIGNASTDGDTSTSFHPFIDWVFSYLREAFVVGWFFCSLLFSTVASLAKCRTNLSNPLHGPERDVSFPRLLSALNPRKAFLMCQAIFDCFERTTCPKWLIVSVENLHLLSLKVTPTSPSVLKILWLGSMRCSYDVQKVAILYKYTYANCHFTHDNIVLTVRWNVPGAFQNPSGIRIALCKVRDATRK